MKLEVNVVKCFGCKYCKLEEKKLTEDTNEIQHFYFAICDKCLVRDVNVVLDPFALRECEFFIKL